MGKVTWTDRVRSEEEVLHRVKEAWNILHTVKRRKANWIGHILIRNCPVKDFRDGKIEEMTKMTGRRRRRRRRKRRRRKQLLDCPNEKRGYWKLKDEALDRSLWRNRFGGGHGPVVN